MPNHFAGGISVSILGGGSLYTPGLVEGFVRMKDSVHLRKLILMDIDENRLGLVGGVVKEMLSQHLPHVTLETTSSRQKAIDCSDFVICQIRVGGLEARHLDEYIPISMGIVGQETTGPGGFAMALRTIPVMLDIARDIERHNPEAWLINYTNPTGLVSEALHRSTKIRHVEICDEPMVLQEFLASFLRVPPNKLFLECFGLNHLSWARRVLLDGKDVLPGLKTALETATPSQVEGLLEEEILDDPKNRMELINTLRIFRETGLLPSPYLMYYYFSEEIVEYQKKAGTRARQVMEIEKKIVEGYKRRKVAGKGPEVERGGKWHADMMVGMLGAIAGDLRQIYIVNVPNRGSLPELSYEKVVEVPAVVGAGGAHPLAMGKMPPEVRGLIQAVASYEEMTVEAALEGSYSKALDALTAHPLVPSRNAARSLLDAYIEAHNFPSFHR